MKYVVLIDIITTVIMKKRYINIRPMFVFFLGLMAGIGISYLFLTRKISVYIAFFLAFLIVLLSMCAFVYSKIHKVSSTKSSEIKALSLLKISSIFLVLSFVIGLGISIYPLYKTMAVPDYYNETTINGTVSDYVLNKEKYVCFILSDCDVDGVRLDYDVLVYTSPFAKVNLGDKISATTNLDSNLYSNSSGFANLIKGIGYTTYIDLYDFEVNGNDASIKDKIKENTFDILSSRLSDDNADIMYSIIFGESNIIDGEIREQFSYAGISHMLAVSGLHVSVLFSLIYFFSRKLKINPKFSLIFMLGILLGYSYLCSFSPSVLRASIMTLLLMLCEIYKIEYDGISGLSIAGIIVLITRPLQFFSVSFRLSFLCVFAIITLAPHLSKLFKKIKMPNALSETLAISISITAVTLPVMISTFETVSLLGVITNIFVIPIFSVLYSLTLFIAVLSFVIRPLSIFLYLPNLLLHIIRVITNYICMIPIAVYRVFNVGYLLIFGIAITCIVIKFVMTSTKSKMLLSACLVALMIGYVAVEQMPVKYRADSLFIYYSSGSNVVYYVNDEEVTLIGSDYSTSALASTMKDLRKYKIDSIVAYDMKINKLDDILEICEKYSVDKLYVPSKYTKIDVGDSVKLRAFDDMVTIANLKITMPDYYDEIPAVQLTLGEMKTLIVDDLTIDEEIYLRNEYGDQDYIITPALDTMKFELMEGVKIICNKVGETDLKEVLNLKLCGKIKIEVAL